MNPTTPPVRNAICIAPSRLPSRAAEATRTFARVASHIPAPPMNALNAAPTTKNSDLPMRTDMPPSCTGSRNSSTTAITTNTPSVRNCRNRYADAPSCTALAMSCIFWVPLPAPSTVRTSTAANPSATRAITAATITYVRFAPVRDTACPSPSASLSTDIRLSS